MEQSLREWMDSVTKAHNGLVASTADYLIQATQRIEALETKVASLESEVADLLAVLRSRVEDLEVGRERF